MEVIDEAKVIALARTQPQFYKDFIRVETAIVKSAINEHFKQSGEIPAGNERSEHAGQRFG